MTNMMTEPAAYALMYLGITAVVAMFGGVAARMPWVATLGAAMGTAYAGYLALVVWLAW